MKLFSVLFMISKVLLWMCFEVFEGEGRKYLAFRFLLSFFLLTNNLWSVEPSKESPSPPDGGDI